MEAVFVLVEAFETSMPSEEKIGLTIGIFPFPLDALVGPVVLPVAPILEP